MKLDRRSTLSQLQIVVPRPPTPRPPTAPHAHPFNSPLSSPPTVVTVHRPPRPRSVQCASRPPPTSPTSGINKIMFTTTAAAASKRIQPIHRWCGLRLNLNCRLTPDARRSMTVQPSTTIAQTTDDASFEHRNCTHRYVILVSGLHRLSRCCQPHATKDSLLYRTTSKTWMNRSNNIYFMIQQSTIAINWFLCALLLPITSSEIVKLEK